jgi:transcriptional regulator with XRE-family HTH domain
MSKQPTPRSVHIPKGWKPHVRSAVLHVISLAHLAIVHSRGWAANSLNARVRLKAENDRLRQEVALLREEIRIKDARMAQIAPQRRPHYLPFERMAILELRAARGWSLAQTARAFLVARLTVADWMRRIDEQGPDALIQLRESVNKFPDFVRYSVQRLRTLCPTMGKAKIAETLARASLHVGVTTAGRMLKAAPAPAPVTITKPGTKRVVTAKYPNHVWHVDLTTVPIVSGFWTTWLPFALPQCWPFCWWVAVAMDHYSRRVMGMAIFDSQPRPKPFVHSWAGQFVKPAPNPST